MHNFFIIFITHLKCYLKVIQALILIRVYSIEKIMSIRMVSPNPDLETETFQPVIASPLKRDKVRACTP